MGYFEICWKNIAEKEIRRIDKKHIVRIIDEVDKLSLNPFPVNSRKLAVSESLYRLVVGEYRIIYHINTKIRLITVYHIRHRKDAYRGL